MRSCNEHAPLIIQEGRARAGQIVQPRREGQIPLLTVPSKQMGEYIYIGGGSDGDWGVA
jgi:hypothetical protein